MKKTYWYALGVCATVFMLGATFIIPIFTKEEEGRTIEAKQTFSKTTRSAWWDTDWGKRKPINASFSSGSASDYQINVNVTYDSDMKSDFSDLRFIAYSDNSTYNAYWIEDKVDSSWCDLWINVSDTIDTTDDTVCYMYYDNDAASTHTNGTDTFLIYSSWENELDGWTESDSSGTYSFDTTYKKFGSYSVKLSSPSGNNRESLVKSHNNGGQDYRIMYWILLDSDNNRWYDNMWDTNGKRHTNIRTYYSGYDGIESQPGSGHQMHVANCVDGRWYKIYYEDDVSANTYDVWVDDVKGQTDGAHRDTGTSDNLDNYRIQAGDGAQDGDVWHDGYCYMYWNDATLSTSVGEEEENSGQPWIKVDTASPADGATNVDTHPRLSIEVAHNDSTSSDWWLYTSENDEASYTMRASGSDADGAFTATYDYHEANAGEDTYYWKISVNDGTTNVSHIFDFETDTITSSVAIKTITFAGNESDLGCPHHLTYDAGNNDTTPYADDGYYINDSRQKEDWIYITVTTSWTDAVYLNYSVNGVWNNGTARFGYLSGTGSTIYYEFNSSGNITFDDTDHLTFDICAFSGPYSSVYRWEKYGQDGNPTRRYVYLDCTPDNFFTYNEDGKDIWYVNGFDYDHSNSEHLGRDDLFHYDGGPDGGGWDTANLINEHPANDGTYTNLFCGQDIGAFINNGVCIEDGTLDNIYWHIFWNRSAIGPISNTYYGYVFTNESLKGTLDEQWTGPETVNSTSDVVSCYSGPAINLSLETKLRETASTKITDNNIYTFQIFMHGEDTSITNRIYSNYYYPSFLIFNVPDNNTLEGMDSDSDELNDYQELWDYGTNPFDSDTDNDGVDDKTEVDEELDPNDPTDAFSDETPPDTPTWLVNPTALSTTSITMACNYVEDFSAPVYYQFNGSDGGNTRTWMPFWSGISATAFTDEGLSENTLCSYTVVAKDSADNVGGTSSQQSAYTLVGKPEDAEFTIDSYGSTWINMSVAVPPNYDQGDTACYFAGDTGSPPDSDWIGGSTNYTGTRWYYNCTGLTAHTTYGFKVKFRNGDGTGTDYSGEKTVGLFDWYLLDTITGSYINTTTYNLLDTVTGSYTNTTTWHLLDTIEGSYINGTEYQLLDTVEGSYINTTLFNLLDTVEGSYINTTSWHLLDTIEGSYINGTEYQLLDTVEGSYINTTSFHLLDTVEGSYINSSTWVLLDTVEGSYINTTSWHLLDTIEGSYINATSFHLLDTIEGSYKNSTTWRLIDTIEGSYINTSNWQLLDTIEGSYINTTSWQLLDTIEGSYVNTTTFYLLDTVEGSYVNTTTFHLLDTIEGSYINTTSWQLLDTVEGSYINTTSWQLLDTIEGSYKNSSTWKLIDTVEGSYINSTTFHLLDTVSGYYTNTTTWHVLDTIEGYYTNSTSFWLIDTIQGSYVNISEAVLVDTIEGSYINTTSWHILDTIEGSYKNTTIIYIEVTNEHPENNSVVLDVYPSIHFTINHTESRSMNYTIYWNTSLNVDKEFVSIDGVYNGTYHHVVENATVKGNVYYWKIIYNDESHSYNDTFKFSIGYGTPFLTQPTSSFPFILGLLGVLCVVILFVMLIKRRREY